MTDATMHLFDCCMRVSGASVQQRADGATRFHQALASERLDLWEFSALVELNPYLMGRVLPLHTSRPVAMLKREADAPGGFPVDQITAAMFAHRDLIEADAAAVPQSFEEAELITAAYGFRYALGKELGAAWRFLQRITGRAT